LDIVPPGELNLWTHDPYKAYVRQGKIFGRGTEDNQQDMVASIFAAKAIMEEGILTPYSMGMGFVADEETSGKKGLYHIINSPNNPIGKKDIIVIPDSGNSDGTLIEITEKSMLWLRFMTTGKQCHGSNPHLGNNAFVAASHLVTQLSQLKSFSPKPIACLTPRKVPSSRPRRNPMLKISTPSREKMSFIWTAVCCLITGLPMSWQK